MCRQNLFSNRKFFNRICFAIVNEMQFSNLFFFFFQFSLTIAFVFFLEFLRVRFETIVEIRVLKEVGWEVKGFWE